MVNVLARLHLLQQPDTRADFVQILRERLGARAEVRDCSTPRQQCIEIVRVCLPVPDAVAVAVNVVRHFTPNAAELPILERLTYEVDALDFLRDEDWHELWQPLTDFIPHNASRLFQRATGDQLAAPPPWCASAWDMFIHLAGQNAPFTGLPPATTFLLLLEHEADTTLARLLRRRNQRWATDHQLTAELERRRMAMNAGNDQPSPFVYLVIQVEPDLSPDRDDPEPQYTVSHYRQWQGSFDSWHSRPGTPIAGVRREGLEDAVENIVRQTEVSWSDRHAEVVVELVLPLELLNEDVAWWRKERASTFLEQKVLAMDYPVVIRSLDRLRHNDWHRAWRIRWERLRAEPASSLVHYSNPDDGADYFTRLEAGLNSDYRWSTLVLSEPPTDMNPNGVREIMTALRAGLPIVVWHRTGQSDATFSTRIREMTMGGRIANLPVHIRRSRLEALGSVPEVRDEHIGRHLAILWDDPERTPELDKSVETEG